MLKSNNPYLPHFEYCKAVKEQLQTLPHNPNPVTFNRCAEIANAYNIIFDNQLFIHQLLHHCTHNIKLPVANIEGLLAVYNFNDPTDVENIEVVKMLQTSFNLLLQNFSGITHKLDSILRAYKLDNQLIDIKETLLRQNSVVAARYKVKYKFRLAGGNILLNFYPYLVDRAINSLLIFLSQNIDKQMLVINVSGVMGDKYQALHFTINNIHISQAKMHKYLQAVTNINIIIHELKFNYLSDIAAILNYSGGYFTIDYSANKLCFIFNFPKL